MVNKRSKDDATRRKEQNEEFLRQLKKALEKRRWMVLGDRPLVSGTTIHFPGTPGDARGELGLKAGHQLNKIMGDSNNVVAPQSYEDRREVQALRWIATVAHLYLDKVAKAQPVEVQVALHDGAAYIAANSDAANTALAALARENRTGSDVLQHMVDGVAKVWNTITTPDSEDGAQCRLDRHLKKAENRLLSDPHYARYEPIVLALGQRLVVCSDGVPTMHAERRIVRAAGEVPEFIAGTRRPCVSCYIALFNGRTDIRPGPFWPTQAANIGYAGFASQDAEAFADLLTRSVDNTYVTLLWECKDYATDISQASGQPKKKNRTTVNYGTDSDSDPSGSSSSSESGSNSDGSSSSDESSAEYADTSATEPVDTSSTESDSDDDRRGKKQKR